jgi:hypothetical protein
MRRAAFLGIAILSLSGLLTSAHAADGKSKIAFGLGLPYGGGAGVNYEHAVTDHFAPTLGQGWVPDNFGWNVGFRIYFTDRDAALQWRTTALYGVNTLLERPDGDYETEEGLSVGLGLDWRYGQTWGFEFDLFWADSDFDEALYDEYGPEIKISFGWGKRWP